MGAQAPAHSNLLGPAQILCDADDSLPLREPQFSHLQNENGITHIREHCNNVDDVIWRKQVFSECGSHLKSWSAQNASIYTNVYLTQPLASLLSHLETYT